MSVILYIYVPFSLFAGVLFLAAGEVETTGPLAKMPQPFQCIIAVVLLAIMWPYLAYSVLRGHR